MSKKKQATLQFTRTDNPPPTPALSSDPAAAPFVRPRKRHREDTVCSNQAADTETSVKDATDSIAPAASSPVRWANQCWSTSQPSWLSSHGATSMARARLYCSVYASRPQKLNSRLNIDRLDAHHVLHNSVGEAALCFSNKGSKDLIVTGHHQLCLQAWRSSKPKQSTATFTSKHPISTASWSGNHSDRFAIAGLSTNDVEIFNLARSQPAMVLAVPVTSSGRVATCHNRGFLAVQTLKDCGYMLAAGGFGGKVMIWDARAYKYPSAALQARSNEVITSLCTPQSHLIVAGTKQGNLHMWDLRKVGSAHSHVFSAQNKPGSSGAIASHNLFTSSAACATRLPSYLTSALAVGTWAQYKTDRHERATFVPDSGTLESHGEADGSISQEGSWHVGPVYTSTYGLSESSVTQVLLDPLDPDRMAFALACGAAGVMRLSLMQMTHNFNPLTHAPPGGQGPRCSIACAESCIAWNADGSMLYRTGHQRDIIAKSKHTLSMQFRHTARSDLEVHNMQYSKCERPLYTLDVSNRASCPLRTAAVYGQPGNGACSGDVAWCSRTRKHMTGEGMYVADIDTKYSVRSPDVEGGEEDGLVGLGKEARLGFLESGVGSTWAGVSAQEACTISSNPDDRSLVLWSDSNISEIST